MATDKHRISLPEALEMVARARQNPQPITIKGWQFEAAIIREILDQPGAAGIRAYLAQTAGGEPTLVLVGTTSDGSDLADGVLAEYGVPCPPFCPDDSPFLDP